MTSFPLLVVRPEPGNAATVAAARSRGLTALAAPLFRIEPVSWEPPPPERFDAIVFGSANALRAGGAGLASLARLPAYAVGEATAQAARAAGFEVVAAGNGGLRDLLPRLAADRRRAILRLAGEDHVAVEPPPGLRIETLVIYAARPLPLPPDARRCLRQPAVVALHSGAAARAFAEECDRARLSRGGIALACLGQRIAEAAGDGWRTVRIAPEPTETALLALAVEMCESA